MERTKRQRENIIHDDKKKKKLIIDSNSASRRCITHFEDLSNEIFYEVFEYLDIYQIYQAFFDLNIRFQNLLTHSNFPINVDLSLKSKTSIQYYYENILIPYQHRIKSLHLSNPLIIERIFSSSLHTPAFTRLEKLTLRSITSILLEQLLTHFISSSHLLSLDVTCIDIAKDTTNLYRQIFRLPALKYCKLWCKRYVSHGSLPAATNEYSLIEYLVIKHQLQLYEVNTLLSYVPQLRRLSLQLGSGPKTVSPSIVLNHLTHVSLKLYRFTFDQVESMMKIPFHHIQVLYFSIGTRNDTTYFNADRWKQLVLTSLPYLRVFDIKLSVFGNNFYHDDNTNWEYLNRIDEFNSSFWTEKKWFFRHASNTDRDDTNYFLYSINPYRRKHFKLNHLGIGNINTNGQKYNMDSVDSVNIDNEDLLTCCEYYFPNVTSLSASGNCFSKEINSIHLHRIIPLEKLTTLDIILFEHSFSNIIEILQRVPNIHTLNIQYILPTARDSILFEEYESFRLVSKTNKITKMKIVCHRALKITKFLVMLCPRLEHLTIIRQYGPISCSKDTVKTLLQFLLSKVNNNTRYLSSLFIDSIPEEQTETVKTFIESEKLHDISIIEVDESSRIFSSIKLYFWW